MFIVDENLAGDGRGSDSGFFPRLLTPSPGFPPSKALEPRDGGSGQVGAAGRGRGPCFLQGVPPIFHVGEGQWARSQKV